MIGVHTHDGIVMYPADESRFGTLMGAPVDVIDDARIKGHPLTYHLPVEIAIKIDPLAAIFCP